MNANLINLIMDSNKQKRNIDLNEDLNLGLFFKFHYFLSNKIFFLSFPARSFSTFTEEGNELVNDHNSESDSKQLIESEKKRHKWTDNEISCILVGAKKYVDNKRISWKNVYEEYKEFLSIDISTILMATKYKDLKKSLIFNE